MFVANQPQFKLALPLITVAWILGALFKGYFSTDRIQDYLFEAQKALPPGITLKFRSGEISLADGWIPEFALLLQDVSIEVTSTCLVNPELQIANARLPLLGLIKKKPSWNVSLGETVLTLKSPFEECFNKKVLNSQSEKSDKNVKIEPQVLAQEKLEQSGELDSLFIEKLIVHDLSRAQPIIGLEWKLFKWERQQAIQSWIAQFQFQAPAELLGSSTPLRVITNIKSQKSEIELTAKGFWREGIIEAKATGDIVKNSFDLDFEFTDFPFESVLSLAKMYHFLPQVNFNFGRNWISAKGHIKKNDELIESTLNGLTLQGDVGLLKLAQPLSFDLLKKYQKTPLVLNAEKLSLSFIDEILDDQRIKNSIRNFGTVSGQLESFRDEAKFNGNLMGLTFIFSNLGSRADQVFENCKVAIEHNSNENKLEINQCTLEGGQFSGLISATKNLTEKIKFEIGIDNLELAPKVQKVLTQGGRVSAIKGRVSIVESLKKLKFDGVIETENLKVLGSEWSKVKVVLKEANEKPEIVFSGKGLFNSELSYLKFLENLSIDQNIESDYKGVFSKLNEDSWAWSQFQVANNLWSIESAGQFNSDETVQGQITVYEKNKSEIKKFKILGSRNAPQIETLK